jgi:transposase
VIVIGADSHKRTHTVVAVDQVGRRLGERTVKATSDGHLELLVWSASWPQARFALEDCRHLTRRLEQDLLAAGQPVVRVPTRLMAAARRGARRPGKSDPIDAEAVALAALCHDARRRVGRTHAGGEAAGRLPPRPGPPADPGGEPAALAPARARPGPAGALAGLRRYKVIDDLAAKLAGLEGTVARLARRLLARCRELTVEINAVEAELRCPPTTPPAVVRARPAAAATRS